MKIYLVGGAVRDELLSLPIKERDWVVVGATAAELLAQDFLPVGKSFPVFLHPTTREEYALARTERKVAGGYHGFEFDTSRLVTLEEDLGRRDLTINAIAKDEQGKLIDPYGGQKDLKQKVLRHVSPAFGEDPVRVLRVARFAARYAPLGFTIAKDTLALMEKMGQMGELNHLVPERIWKELVKALEEKAPVFFIQTLKQCGALKIILPELDALYGIPQEILHHPEKDTGTHMELVLKQATQLSSNAKVRFAALLHDLGKALTPFHLLPKHPSHEERGVEVVRKLCERLKVPSDFQQLAELVCHYHGESYKAKTAKELLAVLEKCDAFRRPERWLEFLTAIEADFRGRPGYETADFAAKKRLSQAFASAQAINTKAIVQSFSFSGGEAIKTALYEARLHAIENSL